MSTQPNEGTPLQTAVRKPMTEEARETRRKLNERYRRFKCAECGTHYQYESDAQTCCPADMTYVCPECDEEHYSAEEAQRCEQSHVEADTKPLEFNCCPVCKLSQDDAEDAIEHCLWKSMAFADRLHLIGLIRTRRYDEAQAIINARKH